MATIYEVSALAGVSLARSLAPDRLNSVGVLVPMFHGPFYRQMPAGHKRALAESGLPFWAEPGDAQFTWPLH